MYKRQVLTLAMIVRNSWVEARDDDRAKGATRRSLVILALVYFTVIGAVLLQSLA